MKKHKWLGAILDLLVPALGQVYAHKPRKGIRLYVLSMTLALLPRWIAYTFPLLLASFALVIAWRIYLVILAYKGVNPQQGYAHVKSDKWYVYCGLVLAHLSLVFVINDRRMPFTRLSFATIPTTSMSPVLHPGDMLVYDRSAAERDALLIFRHPDHLQSMYVKRCIGMPGDSLQIVAGRTLINGLPATERSLKFRYEAHTDSSAFTHITPGNPGLHETDYMTVSPGLMFFMLTHEEADSLKKWPGLKSLKPIWNTPESTSSVYLGYGNSGWNADFYGPLYIPGKNDTIVLTEERIALYLKCIESENESVVRDSSGLIIDGTPVQTYVFRQNYYFVLGDNRHNSADSRFWGFVPEELVIGKGRYLAWSNAFSRIGLSFR